MSEGASALPVLEIEGAKFDDFEGFQREFSQLLEDWTWNGNLDAFNDILRGGFGTPEDGWILRWRESDRSRHVLGHQAQRKWLQSKLTTCHRDHRARVRVEIEAASRGEGPTLFDVLVEIIRIHGPGGDEHDDGVVLELV